MPEVIERGNIIGRLKVLGRSKKHAHHNAVCYVCKRTVTLSARELRLKRETVNCRHCVPQRPQPKLHITRGRNGWLEIQEAA